MARIPINYGTIPGDDTGDILFTSVEKINKNFIDIYKAEGWGYYVDDGTSAQIFDTTPSLLTINGLNTDPDLGSNSTYLPLEIRGSSELWDVLTNKITPIGIGDSYDIRIGFTVSAKTGTVNYIDVVLDLGGGVSPTVVRVTTTLPFIKIPPFNITISFPVFSLTQFMTNGGQIFISTDSGTITVTSKDIFIKRDYKANS